jgi:hemolysin activation/secretion protein
MRYRSALGGGGIGIVVGVLGLSPVVALAQAVDPVNVRGTQVQAAALAPQWAAPQVLDVPANRGAIAQAVVPAESATAPAESPSSAPAQANATAPAEVNTTAPDAAGSAMQASTAPAEVSSTQSPGLDIPGVGATADDGKAYHLTGIKIDYKSPNPQQPPIADLLNSTVTLGVTSDGYIAPRSGIPTVKIKLGEIGKEQPHKIYRSGIAAIYGSIVRYLNARSIIGVFVVVDATEIDTSDNDIRPADHTTLQFIVVTSAVKQVRTVSIGENTSETNRVDNPRFASIKAHSPLQPASVTGGEHRQDLLRKDVLDEYVLRLNRQPGRRIDVAVSGTNEPGGVNLDYLVSETRPWYAYVQVSNTGTKQTSDWRERIGMVDNQLTGHDDVLALDYMTAGFAASHAVIGSYELPFFDLDGMRYKLYGSWNEFTASDVGQTNGQFTGNQWTGGNELIWNFFQQRELFLDLAGGFRFSGIETTNVLANTSGSATFFEPYLALRLQRDTELASTFGSLSVVGYFTNSATSQVNGLGRTSVDNSPRVLQYDFSQSIFLEPLLDTERFASGASTLAHELYFTTHGQYAFDYRLFPQAQDVAGGMTSVRGYPESIAAGDSVAVGTLEYRFHVPRVFAIQPDPSKTPFLWMKSFRRTPQQVYGHPDWDLILRTFVDAGLVFQSHRNKFEQDSSLVGAGVGLELQVKQNFNLRVDWGCALNGVKDPVDPKSDVTAGSNRFHISTTILY